MGRKVKVSSEDKLRYVQAYLAGEISRASASEQLQINETSFDWWIERYKEQGELAFYDTGKNKVYSPETKLAAVQAYLNGEGSYISLSAKFGIKGKDQLRQWVKMYNSGKDFSQRKMSGVSRMNTSRKTDKDERVKIAEECIANGKNYGEIAVKYNVSYNQVYAWVKRYTELGEAGLEDRRGRRKVDQSPRSEVEELKIKLAQTEHKLRMAEMERDLLKKVKELERKDLYRK